MATRIFIDGAAGTTGLEIHDRLKGRAEFELIVLDDSQRKDITARKEALHAADVAILCLPDDAARESVKLAEGSKTRIIDASSAHRVADGWTYGFPELIGHDKVAAAQFVSNPGCYPTGFLALVAPLVRAGMIPAHYPFSVNAVSGYSGGGKALIHRFEDEEPTIAFRAYGLNLAHKHLPEMQHHAGLAKPPVFSPSVVPCHRGMVVDVPLHVSPDMSDPAAIQAKLTAFYEPHAPIPGHIVRVIPDASGISEELLNQGTQPWDYLTLMVSASPDGAQMRLIAILDNLGKGASGAAIQNLNIMCGLPENAGLRL